MAGVLWKLEPATAAKHRLYKRYLDAWWPKMLQPTAEGYRRPRVTYVDAFAGPGRYLRGEEGSPVFVLDRLLHHRAADRMLLTRDRVKLIFVEKDKARFEHLQGELTARFGDLAALPVTVVLRRGEAAALTLQLLGETGAWEHPILAVFDSWGNVNVPLNPVIAQIARNPSSEVVVTFGPNWFNRRESEDPDQFDAVFGGRRFWQEASQGDRPSDRWQTWLNAYRSALRRAGFTFQLQFKVVPGSGQPLYLVFGTKHRSGVEARSSMSSMRSSKPARMAMKLSTRASTNRWVSQMGSSADLVPASYLRRTADTAGIVSRWMVTRKRSE
ncbi:three-Cys-motif partner protein TcmP [Kribbella jiaozuonensis]|uniref:Three-Cys-motif partner protein TcmP n=1 Tax=Kribbella jiaozuonensis TaxID=2575441 RepID=A0A4U3LKS2_9ACTN|nr:three-Cys-motif partner protein TcmP [Kribbella jiaozuonensis]TKK76062.1 three-Cys-motif partner protein TcmP [Kribbella jiaozuonensis]